MESYTTSGVIKNIHNAFEGNGVGGYAGDMKELLVLAQSHGAVVTNPGILWGAANIDMSKVNPTAFAEDVRQHFDKNKHPVTILHYLAGNFDDMDFKNIREDNDTVIQRTALTPEQISKALEGLANAALENQEQVFNGQKMTEALALVRLPERGQGQQQAVAEAGETQPANIARAQQQADACAKQLSGRISDDAIGAGTVKGLQRSFARSAERTLEASNVASTDVCSQLNIPLVQSASYARNKT